MYFAVNMLIMKIYLRIFLSSINSYIMNSLNSNLFKGGTGERQLTSTSGETSISNTPSLLASQADQSLVRNFHPFVQALMRWEEPQEAPCVSSLAEVGSRPHIFITVNGARVKALVDSGANISLLHSKFLKHMIGHRPVPNMGPTHI